MVRFHRYSFTFHNVSINTKRINRRTESGTGFTFHNVSINTPSFTIPYTTSLILPFSVNLVIFFICRIQFLIILWKFFYFYNKTSPLSTSRIFCSIIGRQAYCEIDHIRFISSKSFLKQLMFACKIVMDSLFLYKYTILFEYFATASHT